jgi:hypothetical protein
VPRPEWLKPGQKQPEDPPAPDALDPAEERHLANLKLREDLPTSKAVHVAFIEEGWRPWMTVMLRALKASAKPGGRMNRTASNAFQRAMLDAGKLADAVAALLRRIGVDSEEELERIVNAYRQAQRAEPEDNVESATRVLEAHFRTARGRSEHSGIGARLGFTVKGGSEDA